MLYPALSAPNLNNRFVQLAILILLFVVGVWVFQSEALGGARLRVPYTFYRPESIQVTEPHPIDHLVRKAQVDFQVLIAKRTSNVSHGAEEYRKRRGRQPPPGFDAWYDYAQDREVVIVEDFFDQIYDDLNPFWGVPAKQIREQANVYEHRISVRDGAVSVRTDDIKERPWMTLWSDMVHSVASYLPDLDMAINHMDESRIVVPWEEINRYMQTERSKRKIVPASKLKTFFDMDLGSMDLNPPKDFDPEWVRDGPYWAMAVLGCPPESLSRNVTVETDFSTPPPLKSTFPDNSFEGYVLNWTAARSVCDIANIQGIHGTFVEPISIANSKKFFPLFGGSKLPMNNEILLPPAMYWTDDPFYSGGHSHGGEWSRKKDKIIWRGAASGGRNKEENWTRFQRHRFVSMINTTSVNRSLADPQNPSPNFVLPSNGTSDSFALAVQGADRKNQDFVDWVASWGDAGFVNLICFPDEDPPRCPYSDPFYSVEKMMPMKEQYNYKYLPDIDGNSFSGRYRGFLLSTSLPIKATIYEEWHDSRLVPWKHFVPMDNTFIDIYGIMEYFIGNKALGLDGHDQEAQDIALVGQSWAQSVLRKEDMSVYVFRLLLEYARLCDDDRDIMGWTEGAITESHVQ